MVEVSLDPEGDVPMTAWLTLWILLIVDVAVEIGWVVLGERKSRQREKPFFPAKRDFTGAASCSIKIV
jgi:hypothetical protein